MLIVFLVVIFEITRLLALLNKAKIIIFVLAIFSCIFIVSNYKSTSDNSQQILQQKLQVASNINAYTSKYWVNGDKFKQLIDIQNTNINGLNNYLPPWVVIAVLIILIELSMAYMIICNCSNSTPPIKPHLKIVERKTESNNESNNSKQLKVINGKYFTGNHEISRSYYYKLKTKA
ncbi:hypothetical protein HAV_00178 [Candidatus Hepatincola sp. Av]